MHESSVSKSIHAVIIATLLLMSVSSHADSSSQIADEFKELASERVTKAMENGWTSVGSLPLETLSREIQKPTVIVNPEGVEVRIEGRETATWDKRDGAVRVNRRSWSSKDRDTKKGISLHELLGASGIDDRDYQYSLRIDFMERERAAKGSPLNLPVQTRFSGSGSGGGSGGGTGVGGGGDGTEYKIKKELVRSFFETIDQVAALNNDATSNKAFYDRMKAGAFDIRFVFFKHQRSSEAPRLQCWGDDLSITLGLESVDQAKRSGELFNLMVDAITRNAKRGSTSGSCKF